MDGLLEGKNAMIHGAGGAIGGAVARAFAREGARVFLARRTLTRLEAVARDVGAAGGAGEVAPVDAPDERAVNAHADAVARKAGGIDVAVNAVIFMHVRGTPFTELSLEDYAHPISGHALASSVRLYRPSSRWALIGMGVAALALAGCGPDAAVPPAQADAAMAERQAQAFVEALKPRRPGRPVVAVVALNEGTEMTDLMLPHAVLQYAGVADVQVVAARSGRVLLFPALQVEGAQDLAGFDQAHPRGADYVIVPAMRDDDDPAVTGWLRQQAHRGARIIGVCAGALVVGRAGLLDGRHFVTHWYYRRTVLDHHPGAVYVPNQRYVIDRDVATTTGITASVPAMLALVEAIGGRGKAQALAAELGVSSWNPAHDSSRFGLNAARRLNYVLNTVAFWRHERWSVDVWDGMDDIALALAVDAWSRTGRVSVHASASGPVKLRSGLLLVAQPVDQGTPRLPLEAALKPTQQLDRTLCEIAERFGDAQRERAMMELEYAGAASAC